MANTSNEKTAISSVCRIDKTKNFTVMGNYHLRSKNLSLKAIGLLSKVLSLPEGWDYSVVGLTAICKESKTTVKSALEELKKWGYLELKKLTPDMTESGRIEYIYTFFEYSEKDVLEKTITDSNSSSGSDKELAASSDAYQDSMKQEEEKLVLDIQSSEIQLHDIPTQSSIKSKIKKNILLNDEISINQSVSINNSVKKSADRSMDGYSAELDNYTDLVKNKIDYDDFVDWLDNEEEAEEIVLMIARQICSRKPTEIICGQEYPREVVKSAMLKVNISTLEDAVVSVSHAENVCNFEKYLISTLFNAVNTQRFKEDSEAKFTDYAFKRDFGERTV